MSLSESQVVYNGQVIDFNVDGGDFSAQELGNLKAFLDNPSAAAADALAIVVREATPDDEAASEAHLSGTFWSDYLAQTIGEEPQQPTPEELEDPQKRAQWQADLKDHQMKVTMLQAIVEMNHKLVAEILNATNRAGRSMSSIPL